MGGQGHFKHPREKGIKSGWTRIRRGLRRRRRRFIFGSNYFAVCVEGRACRNL
jgi:hypothetical protein